MCSRGSYLVAKFSSAGLKRTVSADVGQFQRRPALQQAATEPAVEHHVLLRELVPVGLQLGRPFGTLVLRLRPFDQGSRPGAIPGLQRRHQCVEPAQILFADENGPVRQRRAEQGDRQFDPANLEFGVLFRHRHVGFRLGDFARETRPAEERQLLLHAIEDVAILGAHLFIGGHAAQHEHGVFPGAHGGHARGGGIGAGAGRLQRGILFAHFLGELIHEFRRDDHGVGRRGFGAPAGARQHQKQTQQNIFFHDHNSSKTQNTEPPHDGGVHTSGV